MKSAEHAERGTRESTWVEAAAVGTVILRGQVSSGRGKGAAFVERHANQIRQALGEHDGIARGSLNVVLKRPILLRDETAIKTHFDKLLRLDWPGRLNGVDVWLHRWESSPLHILELLSAAHLRTRFGLSDGDEIEIEARVCDIAGIPNGARLAWAALWFGRRKWCYTHEAYRGPAQRWSEKYGATQLGTNESAVAFASALLKMMVKKVPGARWLRKRLLGGGVEAADEGHGFHFERARLDRERAASERPFIQIGNLLNYTKTSGSVYSAYGYPAGYHTLDINGRRFQGQRKPAERLKPVPVQFEGKTVLDIGCNQGGMLFELSGPKWAVGIDYDPRMINAANRIKSVKNLTNVAFYVFDLEKDPLDLIEDFLPEPTVDVVFLLAVCAWLANWREVIRWCAEISSSMLYETTGRTEFQERQLMYLRELYHGDVAVLAKRSDDDPGQKNRRLVYCGGGSGVAIGGGRR
jgi:2-polyprenyl-3-methyl-5-hydroxy-6-metoxy-1,4-benzoquinol methylase